MPEYGLKLGFDAFHSIASLKHLRELQLYYCQPMISFNEQQEILQCLVENSGHSLKRLTLPCFPLNWLCSTATIEAMAKQCARLRYIIFHIMSESASPDAIRLLIRSIVERPEWDSKTDELEILIGVYCSTRYLQEAEEYEDIEDSQEDEKVPAVVFAPYAQLMESLPHGVQLKITNGMC